MNMPQVSPSRRALTLPGTFADAKALADDLHAGYTEAGRALNQFLDECGRGPLGLTPDHLKADVRYQALRAASERAFQACRDYNAQYTKRFKAEIAADRQARRALQVAAGSAVDPESPRVSP